jgi:hypothetical protein
MNAKILEARFEKEYTDNFGKKFLFKIKYQIDGEENTGFYSAKNLKQTFFNVGENAEFTTEEHEGQHGTWLKIKPVRAGKFSGFSRQLSKEQTRYSGFAVSYCKDLIIADKLDIKDWEKASKKIFDFMVKLDKDLANDKD